MNKWLIAPLLCAALSSVALATDYHEAPALVAQGKLPPVAERLPTAPEVVTPISSVGRYGGVLRSAGAAIRITTAFCGWSATRG